MTGSPNLLIVSSIFPPHGGGAERATYLYAKHLSNQGIAVNVLTHRFPSEPSTSNIDNMRITRVPLLNEQWGIRSKYLTTFGSTNLLRTHVKKIIAEADVIYVQRPWCPPLPLLKRFRKPVLLHVHTNYLACPLASLYNAYAGKTCHGCHFPSNGRCMLTWEMMSGKSLGPSLLSMLLNASIGRIIPKFAAQADAIVFVSKAQRDIALQHIPSIKEKSHVIYNPIQDRGEPDGSGTEYAYLGGANLVKGIEILMQALKLLPKQITVHAAGEKMDHKFCDRHLDVKSKIRVHGWVDQSKLNKILEGVKCILVPSIWPEPAPYVVIENMLAAKVLIASRIGGIPEICGGSPGVMLFTPGDSQELAETISIVENLEKEQLRELSMKNRETALRTFDSDESVKKMLKIIEKLAS